MNAPARDWSNTRLVEACLDGNEQAWNVLVERYKGLVYSIPSRYGAMQQDAADIFQSVCLELFNELPRLRDAEAIQAWLIRVTTHKCYRWKRQQPAPASEWDAQEIEPASTAGLAPDVMAELEKEALIRASLDELPPRCRQMIELLFFEQPPIPYEEVARRLRLAKGSIGFIRGRCLKRLKDILEHKGF